MALGMGSHIPQVELASIFQRLAPSHTRRCIPRSTFSLPLRPTLVPSSPRWPRVWQGRSKVSVASYIMGSKKMWSQPPRERSRDQKVIRLCGPHSSVDLLDLPLIVMGRKGIVKPSPKSRIYLPDITGLTSAVESPARVRLDYHRVNPADREMQSKYTSSLPARGS